MYLVLLGCSYSCIHYQCFIRLEHCNILYFVPLGGDVDAFSKTLIGVFTNSTQPENTELLIAVRMCLYNVPVLSDLCDHLCIARNSLSH